ncbi:hypothetical protein JZ751_009012 [Albula glossodonta]|uniref:PI-PLC Y-box domain-containing protein n=1 Tax=Albula glossodonta TaxID=121402 RepID=A0A8T2P295_9TELE|nr:hypothetical protein JZ751_009012 [Albula glossodonta]
MSILFDQQELQYKILIKNKKLSPHQERERRPGSGREGEEGGEREEEGETEEGGEGEEDEETEEGDEDSEEEEDFSEGDGEEELTDESTSSPSKRSKKKRRKVKVAMELSKLVFYTKSVKFVNFSHSRETQCFYENTSLAEKKARKLVKNSGERDSQAYVEVDIVLEWGLFENPHPCMPEQT